MGARAPLATVNFLISCRRAFVPPGKTMKGILHFSSVSLTAAGAYTHTYTHRHRHMGGEGVSDVHTRHLSLLGVGTGHCLLQVCVQAKSDSPYRKYA